MCVYVPLFKRCGKVLRGGVGGDFVGGEKQVTLCPQVFDEMAKKKQRTPTPETSPSREDSHSHEDTKSEESGPDTNKEGDKPLYQIDPDRENIQRWMSVSHIPCG
ncbi:AN1-type zinc finger protein 3 [Striga asiatica]|uniref:AN1-type zinc finger protein 3 n=1 Tax=Striga asiatica TaxID=4170 RepID=A0A5A7Q848_STRAF|nr:AN1-type zinc finger protein 3 [Striga asiatica]